MSIHDHDLNAGHSSGHSHTHGDITADNQRRVAWAMVLTGLFTVAEIIGGIMAGSLALIADAGHMLADTVALGLAWWAFRLSRKPADHQRSFGYHRFQVLAAFINGTALITITGWIMFEATTRLYAPEPVRGGLMMGVAVIGLIVNIVAAFILHGGDRESLNMRGAFLHVLGDLLGSVGAIAAALVIMATGWYPADPIISVIIGLLILRSAWSILRESTHILMEGTPPELDPEEIRQSLYTAVEGVEDIHHLHLWSLTEKKPMVTLHARIRDSAESPRILKEINLLLAERFGIGHVTVQIETEDCADTHLHP